MRATILTSPGQVGLQSRPEPAVRTATDAVVRVVAAAVCGSDLWWYRGDNTFDRPRRMGHEFIGRVEEVGRDVALVAPGDLVISAFKVSDNSCPTCRDGYPSNCEHGSYWGQGDPDGHELDGAQGERVRVPLADGTLVRVPEPVTPELLPHLLALADVMPTGVHAAACAGVAPGGEATVIGDGAVGLCGVLAAKRAGAAHVTIMSRHPARQEIARLFGADTVVESRGPDGVAAVREAHGGRGPAHVLECVGTADSLRQAIDVARVGGQIGMMGIPHGTSVEPRDLFAKNLGLRAGGAPARRYLPELVAEVVDGRLRPGAVFDRRYRLEAIAEAYADMAERRTIKAMVDVSALSPTAP